MPLDASLRSHLQQMLAQTSPHAQPARLSGESTRLWNRVLRLLGLGLIKSDPDLDAMELACVALALPTAHAKPTSTHKLGGLSLIERSELASDTLLHLAGRKIEPRLLDRSMRLLHEMPQRHPMSDDARVLADAVNLDDFGVIGLVLQSAALAAPGGVAAVLAAFEKREQYGYWDARLKDSFHFPAVRKMAEMRLKFARHAVSLLRRELADDTPT